MRAKRKRLPPAPPTPHTPVSPVGKPRIRPLRFDSEREFEELAARNGWRTTKRGWPDFLCFDPSSNEIIAVEVKQRLPHRRREGIVYELVSLKPDQAFCLDFFQSKGIRCFVSDGKTLEVYDRKKHYRR